MARAIRDGAGVDLSHLGELVGPSDERRIESAEERRRVLAHAQQPVSHHRLGLSLRIDRLRPFQIQRTFCELTSALADQNLVGARSLFESSRDVDGVAGDQRAAGARHDLARVDAHPNGELDSEFAPQLVVDLAQAVAELHRSPGGAQRVVLVDNRHAEHCHHRVADELLDGAAVTLNDTPCSVEVPLHYLS